MQFLCISKSKIPPHNYVNLQNSSPYNAHDIVLTMNTVAVFPYLLFIMRLWTLLNSHSLTLIRLHFLHRRLLLLYAYFLGSTPSLLSWWGLVCSLQKRSGITDVKMRAFSHILFIIRLCSFSDSLSRFFLNLLRLLDWWLFLLDRILLGSTSPFLSRRGFISSLQKKGC